MDLSKLPQKTILELTQIKNEFVIGLMNCIPEQFYPISLSLIMVLLELLKREFLESFDKHSKEEIDSEENLKKSLRIILKYSNHWNSLLVYSELFNSRGDEVLLENQRFFYNVLKSNNPAAYNLLLEALAKISQGQLELEL